MSLLIFSGGPSHLLPVALVLFIVFLSDRELISCCHFVWDLGPYLHKLITSTSAKETNLQCKMLAS